jgi:hypothetical protein
MTAYCKLQEAEFASEKDGYETVKHERFVLHRLFRRSAASDHQRAKRRQRRSKVRPTQRSFIRTRCRFTKKQLGSRLTNRKQIESLEQTGEAEIQPRLFCLLDPVGPGKTRNARKMGTHKVGNRFAKGEPRA